MLSHPHSPPSRRAVLGTAAVATATAATTAGATGLLSAPAQAAGPADGPHRPREPRPGIWHEVLDDADLVWRKMPTAWFEGPFLGNALLGSTLYAEPDAADRAVRLTVQHSEVQDHRPEFGSLFGLARLPIGHFTLEPAGKITAVDWRLRLYDAELTGTITTTAGRIRLRALVHNSRAVLAVEVSPSAGERDVRWTFHPAEAVSPRGAFKEPPEGYTANPPAEMERHGDTSAAVQPLHAGGEHVTAWRENGGGGGVRTLYVAVAHSHPARTAREAALKAVRSAAGRSFDALAAPHRAWWHAYYRKSFLSVPDARIQRFYWIQLYKVASAARADAPVMATSGPWLEPTPWPATWWNLNVQLEYWLIHGSNHLELDAVTRALSEHRDQLSAALAAPYRKDSAGIPRTTDIRLRNGADASNGGYGVGIPGQSSPTPEVGNLTWALHNVWLSHRHTMDEGILRETLFPLLRKAVNYYLHFLEPGSDGKLHLPLTFSPEYPSSGPDCNYDLMLLRWGCRTLLDAAETLGIKDELAPRWRDVLARLTPYPQDENGFMIAAGVPFAQSHRHYSHLLAVYPLYEVTWEQPAHREVIETSLEHWVGFEGALQGYTFTGAASMSAQMGRGEKALEYLGELMERFIQPNTMYKESGPVIETPLSAAQSLHDMVCQSWGGTIRVFPAVPEAWRDVSVHDFRTQGAFLLSAARQGGRTRWVKLRSEAGAPCAVRHSLPGPVEVRDARGRPLPHEEEAEGTLRIGLREGEEAVLTVRGERPDMSVGPVRPNTGAPRWGLPS
ncbi:MULTISPECIES: glycosyl hydrolase family 95 catalytic domain-containing protein [unclassified Streptomyces]|uniref:glycosyl hydrolase family 95 catalytic domain-containing protein n=1 Tax=unclassified Streptomyces TaxID=2593676 RepID=UPI002DDAF3F5|nr:MULTISPECIES: Tat pathway signal sequence domain protein [unclassified Streptomyces]WSA90475.1 Tat pathway signal sequence domain protein [Streptomyces sp. NBC_01795]WSB74801.1 Tat pathway signal sequence domain protein [Streptomyces sp. NBC_01775]WSS16916.1 Tat pathway signal sequence domain protein [Streptomyces sp. NBC_01186]WSS45660.1 Tat pathway signal sequence domain protein [Streptomyces sp. NBC_01187]